MITVTVSINGKPIITRSARNIEINCSPDSLNKYKVDDGRIVYHRPKDGPADLAVKMLQGVKKI